MKSKNFFVLLFLFLLAGLAGAEDLTIRRISVTGTETTAPALVEAAFLEVAVGDTLPRDRLEEVAVLVKHRLEALGYFSSVDVTLVPSKANPGVANLVAEVTEGFTGRFGGGPIYAYAGWGNLGGQGRDVGVGLGWNIQALTWTDHFVGTKGWSWSATGGNRPLVWVDTTGLARENHALGGIGSVTRDWGWGWTTTLAAGADGEFDPDYRNPAFRPTGGATVAWSRVAPEFSPDRGASASFQTTWIGPRALVREGADLRAYLPLGAGFKGAFRAAGSTQQGPFDPRDALVLSGLNGVRQAFDPADLTRSKAWASAELRWAAPAFDLFGFTTLTVEPALVADAGNGWSESGTSTGMAWAAGGALRLFINAPVFVPIRLEETVDHRGKITFFFGVQAPY